MGQSDTITASIGIRLLIGTLVSAITSENFETIKKMFFSTWDSDCLIEDQNCCYNENFRKIIEGADLSHDPHKDEMNYLRYGVSRPNRRTDMDELTSEEYKERLTKMFQLYGDVEYYKSGGSSLLTYEPEDEENLFNQYLLVPQQTLLSSERWGYSRQGTNGSSKTLGGLSLLDFTETANEIKEKMRKMKIEDYSLVLILSQHTG